MALLCTIKEKVYLRALVIGWVAVYVAIPFEKNLLTCLTGQSHPTLANPHWVQIVESSLQPSLRCSKQKFQIVLIPILPDPPVVNVYRALADPSRFSQRTAPSQHTQCISHKVKRSSDQDL